MAEAETVLFETRAGVAYVTMNRPEKRNALNEEVVTGLKAGLRRANADESTRCIVLRGAGSDFCAGADLSALQKIVQASVAENLDDAQSLAELFLLIRELDVPVIAAVRGRALAGGSGLALACDIVLAERDARFGFPEVKIGFVPAMVMAILRRNVSEKRAFELITRGAEISADEAKEFGLVNQVFPNESFAEDVNRYVAEFEKMSASAIGLTKTLLYQMDGMGFPEALETGADVNVIARLTDDCRQRIAKFLQKDRS